MIKQIDNNANKFNLNQRVSWELIIILLINFFVPSELFLIIAFCYLMFLVFIRNHGILIINTCTNIIYLIIILLIGTIIGLVHIEEYGTRELIRDIFYIVNPIIFINIGVYIQRTWKGKYDIYITIIILAVIVSIINVFSLFGNIQGWINSNSVGSIRDIGYVDISAILGLVLLLTQEQRGIKYFGKGIKSFFTLICIVAVVISFSRTYFVTFFILIATIIMGKNKIHNKNFIRIYFTVVWIIVICGVIYMFIPVTLINDFFTKLARSFTEISSNGDWSNTINIVYDWRGYEIYRAKKVFLTGNIIDKFLGYGFGKGIDVGEFSYLVLPGSDGMIPVLHNGYYTMLIKNGIVGLILYLLFYFSSIKTAIRNIKNKRNLYESKFQIGILLALMTLTYFVAGIVSKSSYLVLCLLIGYYGSNKPIDEDVNSYSDTSR